MRTLIDKIDVKVGELVEKYRQLILVKEDLQQTNDILNAKLDQKEEQILALQDKIKLMNISKSVDGNKEDIKATRLKINEYVREIDKCIGLLNK